MSGGLFADSQPSWVMTEAVSYQCGSDTRLRRTEWLSRAEGEEEQEEEKVWRRVLVVLCNLKGIWLYSDKVKNER